MCSHCEKAVSDYGLGSDPARAVAALMHPPSKEDMDAREQWIAEQRAAYEAEQAEARTRLHVYLQDPDTGTDADDGEGAPSEIVVGLMHVRAANDLVIDYDFDRDGYRIRMSSEGPRDREDGQLVEVAFVPAWVKRT